MGNWLENVFSNSSKQADPEADKRLALDKECLIKVNILKNKIWESLGSEPTKVTAYNPNLKKEWQSE